MNRKNLFVSICVAGALVAGWSIARAQQAQDAKPPEGAKPEMKLPPGWTEADMQACMAAGTPGKMHEELAKDIGVWAGKTTMWMGPGTEATKSECTATYSSFMDGRFIKCEIAGEMPGMGAFSGFGLYGFDNVTQKFVSTWVDNHGTGIMIGEGERSPGAKSMTWKFTYNCPIQKKPCVMREVDTVTGPRTKKFEMFGADPKSGKEYRMMLIEYMRKS